MATRSQWIDGARTRTLPAAVAPVLVGTSIAEFEGSFRPLIALLALVVSLSLQVGVNYANDYSDGIRGTDENRVGPVRLVGQKLATPEEVKRAAFISFGISALAGLGMVLLSQVWLLGSNRDCRHCCGLVLYRWRKAIWLRRLR
jgi:1,4-dihydroxy-2-naphthoate polyprenyltransferase